MYDEAVVRETDKADKAPIRVQIRHYAELIHRLSTGYPQHYAVPLSNRYETVPICPILD